MDATQTQKIVRLPAVMGMTGLSRASVYAFVKAHTFPAPVKLGPKASGWLLSEVQGWIVERVNARRVK
ncbi:MAG TPA: AlpA family transcriptional regulator [Burkholderiales bacterium]